MARLSVNLQAMNLLKEELKKIDSVIANCDTISDKSMLEYFRTLTIEKIRKLHPYKITEPRGKKGRWRTYIIVNNKRFPLAKTNEKDFFDALIKYYSNDENKKITLKDFYPEWMKKKEISTASVGTLKRYNEYWVKYYLSSDIVRKPISKITRENLEDFYHSTIKKFNMSRKELGNMQGIMKGMMLLSYERGIITNNLFETIVINKKLCRHVPKKSNSTQVYLPKEKENMLKALDEEFLRNPEVTDALAIKLLFNVGTRISELVALKWSDIENDTIHIQRMETKVSKMKDNITFEKARYVVVEHVKTNNNEGDRFLHLTPSAIEILKKVKEINEKLNYYDNDFIFCDENGRTTSRAIAYHIEKCCKNAGLIKVKSAHDIRRTVASLMYNHGVALDEIRRFLGHTNEKTTLSYLFNTESNEDTNSKIDKALN